MQFFADILLLMGALGATIYCIVLARRLRTFTNLESGVGGAIAVLSAQVDDMTKSVEAAREIAQSSATSLDALTDRAELASRRLELLVASLHDLPELPDAVARSDEYPSASDEPGVPVESPAGGRHAHAPRIAAGGGTLTDEPRGQGRANETAPAADRHRSTVFQSQRRQSPKTTL